MKTSAAPEVLLARYGELWLKGKNRGDFEKRLARNVRRALRPIDEEAVVDREHGMLVIRPTGRQAESLQRLGEVFGISSISPARGTEHDIEAIGRTSLELMRDTLARLPQHEPIPFRVETRRSDKRFPMTSPQIDRAIADVVMLELGHRLKVDLSTPELVLGINVRPERVYVFSDRMPGAGGLPVGSVGRVVSLLSGGIDSPVASYMAMKRGLHVIFSAFHSYPYVGRGFVQKVEKLARRLSRFQNAGVLYTTPLTRIQEAIRDEAPTSYRTVLYRRAMQRLATRIAAREKANALVTGECVGQVASQTLENMHAIETVSPLPVLRPLVAFDKEETIQFARRIGTFELSIIPEPDCCSVFQPPRAALNARVAVCENVESSLPMDEMIEEALDKSESLTL